jgi:hypothetical protein
MEKTGKISTVMYEKALSGKRYVYIPELMFYNIPIRGAGT